MFSFFYYFIHQQPTTCNFYIESLKKEFKRTYQSKKDYYHFKHKFCLSDGICCPKDVFLTIFEKLPLAKLNWKVKGNEIEDIFELSINNFMKMFNFNANCNKRNYSYVLKFPIFVLYCDDNIKFLFDYDCFIKGSNEKHEFYSDDAKKKIFQIKKPKKNIKETIKPILNKKII
jgi:hypothetical protein